jgi:hypothetical protein
VDALRDSDTEVRRLKSDIANKGTEPSSSHIVSHDQGLTNILDLRLVELLNGRNTVVSDVKWNDRLAEEPFLLE